MPLKNLTKEEKQIVFECLQAVAYTQFIDDATFHTLMGIHRETLVQVIKNWGNLDESSVDVDLAINNSMNSLNCLAPDEHEVWSKYISVTRDEVERVFYKWLGEPVPPPETWDGVICGAISKRSRDIWNNIDEKIQNEFLTSVWCANCEEQTTITTFEGYISRFTEHLTLSGRCVKCFHNIELRITPDNIKNIRIKNKQDNLKRNIIC